MRAPSLLLALLATPALGQTTIDTIDGATAGDLFGASVAFVGDLNHDGRADFAVGAPGDDHVYGGEGSVTVFSGADRSILFYWTGPSAQAALGESVDGLGDVDLDGTDDVIAGAPGANRVHVYSGLTGAILFDLAPGGAANFGHAVCGIGLADADGWPDFAVGATSGTGLWVYSGQTGLVQWSDPTVTYYLDGLGDINGDGYDDFIVGDPSHGWNWGGRARVFSGRTGAVIREYLGDSGFSEMLGTGACGLGDIDGDGVGDFGFGVPCSCFASHYASFYSGATGHFIDSVHEYWFGYDLSRAGDLDLDGVPDILVAAPSPIHVLSGADRSEITTLAAASTLDGGEDADGDGYLDFLGGSPGAAPNGPDSGQVSLYTIGCPYPPPANYCDAADNSTGGPASMDWMNSTSVAKNDFRLFAEGCPPDQFAFFYYGVDEAYAPLGDGFRCVKGPLYRFNVVQTGPTGVPTWSVDFPNPPQPSGQISSGETWYFSLWFRDPTGGPNGSNLADGLRVTFCP